MTRKLFLNLKVNDLAKSRTFFEQLGFQFNNEFSNDDGAAMIVNEDAWVMLLTENFFKQFTEKNVIDATANIEAMTAFSAESREEVDELYNKAIAAGATQTGKAMDQDGMYSKAFADLDGHHWECVYMDFSAPAQ